jgi:hypothetical protein
VTGSTADFRAVDVVIRSLIVVHRPRRCAVLFLTVLFLLGLVGFATRSPADELGGFSKRIKQAVDPNFDGEPFADNTVVRQMGDRYNDAFPQATSFQSNFSSDNVGGILLRLRSEGPVKPVQLQSASFRIENGGVDKVLFRLTAENQQTEFRVPATIIPAAALMAADRRLVLLTLSVFSNRGNVHSHADMAAAHPAIVKHQLAYMAASLDLSLQNVMTGHGRNYLLCEKPWKLSLKEFSARDDLFKVRCRIDRAETTPPGITDDWRERLADKQREWFTILNNFATVHRLVRAAIDRDLVGFPENDFIKLLKELQPIYAKHKLTKDQAAELQTMLAH